MSNEHEDHDHPAPMRFRFTFKRRFRRAEVHSGVIGSQIIAGGTTYYMLTKDGQVTEAVPLGGGRVLVEPMGPVFP